jgi:hypothetical protein
MFDIRSHNDKAPVAQRVPLVNRPVLACSYANLTKDEARSYG